MVGFRDELSEVVGSIRGCAAACLFDGDSGAVIAAHGDDAAARERLGPVAAACAALFGGAGPEAGLGEAVLLSGGMAHVAVRGTTRRHRAVALELSSSDGVGLALAKVRKIVDRLGARA